MYGAIIGDIVGSRFEFDNHLSKRFQLFHKTCTYTDDSVMTLAVAKALLSYDRDEPIEAFQAHLVETMHDVGNLYWHCSYGQRFYDWLISRSTEPYNSFGNGSAMRVSAVAWAANSLEECERLAKATAEVTHNHPEGIKGAVAVAGAIFLALCNKRKLDIEEYVSQFYDLDFPLDENCISFDAFATCEGSVPQAIRAFLDAKSFEDTLRNAVSIGGDSDTIAAIAGSIAEAFYGVKEAMIQKANRYLDPYLIDIADRFNKQYKKGRDMYGAYKKLNGSRVYLGSEWVDGGS